MKRDLFIAGPAGNGAPRPWKLTLNGKLRDHYNTQQGAVDAGVQQARNRLSLLGRTAELQIRGKDGQIQDTRTYGDDPREVKG